MSFLRGKFDLQEPPMDARLPEERKENEGIWQYGDEASLYSIAEDSREDKMSVSSEGLAAKDTLKGNAWIFGSFWPQDAEEPLPTPREQPPQNGGNAKKSSLPAGMGVELSILTGHQSFDSKGDEIYYYYPQKRWRRLAGASFLICLMLVGGTAAAVLLVGRAFSDGTTVQEQRSSSLHSTDETMSAQESGTQISLDEDTKFLLSQNYVYNSIQSCRDYADTLFDTATHEGKIFSELVDEVYSAASDDSSGSIDFHPLHSRSFLRERFALEMLYYSTVGSTWLRNNGWMSGGDPCDGWLGVDCTSQREKGSCAVTGLLLDGNGLGGELPEALCCLPCVEHIGMSENSIGGPILTCLAEIQSLQSLEFQNNKFGMESTTP